jgi:hypothetical protein
MKKKIGFLGFGILFGFALSRVGASDFNLIYGLFTAEDVKLAWVIISAIIVGAVGMQILKRLSSPVRGGQTLKISHKELGRFSIYGALIFGFGWGISGACPGTVLAQLGEGKILGFFTFIGMICGTYIYAFLKEKVKDL